MGWFRSPATGPTAPATCPRGARLPPGRPPAQRQGRPGLPYQARVGLGVDPGGTCSRDSLPGGRRRLHLRREPRAAVGALGGTATVRLGGAAAPGLLAVRRGSEASARLHPGRSCPAPPAE